MSSFLCSYFSIDGLYLTYGLFKYEFAASVIHASKHCAPSSAPVLHGLLMIHSTAGSRIRA